MNDIVIRFFEILRHLVKYRDEADSDLRIRFFEKEVNNIPKSSLMFSNANLMLQEIEICRRRKRSRIYMYNMSNLDEACDSYLISGGSPVQLNKAWNMFVAESYKIERTC